MAFDWVGLLKNAAPILGGMSKSGVDANAARDRNAILKEQMRLNRDKFAVDAPDKRLSTSTRASILSNFKPTSVEWGGPGSGERGELPKISGGLSDSIANLDPQTKQLVQQILKDELASQMRGGETGGGQDRAVDLGADFGKSSTGDKVTGAASTVASLLSAVPGLGGKGAAAASSGTPSYITDDIASVAAHGTDKTPWWERIFGGGSAGGNPSGYDELGNTRGDPNSKYLDPWYGVYGGQQEDDPDDNPEHASAQ